MQIPWLTKKNFLILGLFFIGVGGVITWLYYQHRQNLRLERKIKIENQKAEEISITIIEGWSNREIGAYLEKQGVTKAADFLAETKKYQLGENKKFLPKEVEGDLQGFLYPDTYRLFKSIADRNITSSQIAAQTVIAKLLDTFIKKLPANAESLAQKQNLSLYQAVILASIIENETGRNAVSAEAKAKLDEERRIVAGIFYNRLGAKMALQSDATINYISGKNDPAPLLSDLDINSPYNTYKHQGLPPTPIGNPSHSALSAVLNPAKTDYFYFLHKQPSGEPVYAKTFEEHVQNKQKYLK